MGSRPALVRQLVESGLIAVVRARSRKQATPIALALRKGGIRAVEITMTTPDAIGAIADITRDADPSLLPGAGTVLDIKAARRAIDAGARFVVSPDLRPEVVKVCHERNIPVLMGAFTPTEMQRVHESGSDFVKFFPADFGGAAHVKAVRAPLPHLRIIPTGGVNLESMESFLSAGCPALGVGSSLITRRILDQDDWEGLERRARLFVDRFETIRSALKEPAP